MAIRIDWSDNYCIDGNIDNEHRRLFELANEVFEIVDPDFQSPKLKQAVSSLFEYLELHFGNEQRLMTRIGYPEYDNQLTMHKAIIAQANEMMKSSRTLEELHTKVQQLMVHSFLTHILRDDQRIGLFIRREPPFFNKLRKMPAASAAE